MRFLFVVVLLAAALACSDDASSNTDVIGDTLLDGDAADTADAADAADAYGTLPEDTETVDAVQPEEVTPPAPFMVVAQELPTTATGAPFNATIEATGGATPYEDWRVIDGALPEGIVLDAATGVLSGSATEDGVFAFVVAVDDNSGVLPATASELFGLRIGDGNAEGPLRARARAFQEVYEARHLWHGMSYGNLTPDDPEGNFRLNTLGDASFVSGNCTMAMAFRHAVEPSPEALAVITEQVEGWRFFQDLTGVPGLIGRSYMRLDDPVEDSAFVEWESDELPPKWIRGEGEFDGWIWRADTSRDQMSGAVLGVAAAYDLVGDEHVKAEAREFLVQVADHIWGHDLQIVDPDGEPTTHGDVSGERLEHWPLPNGQAATCSLAWLLIAHHVSGEARFKEAFDELMFERNYLSIMRDFQWVYAGYNTRWFNTYISWENFYHMMRLVEDVSLREALAEIFRDTLWLNTDDDTPNRRGILEHNPVKTPWYLFTTASHDPVALYQALAQIIGFPEAPLRDSKVVNSTNANIEKNPEQPEEALYALPSWLRPPDMVIWHRGPYKLDGGQDNGEERTGCDYLLPYWMGRYYGYIGETW